ncbi:DUF4913 domain-containing protein [Streptomyces noursei]|uniref:DUF4913 domain-containing protein n=1 Tax=Streptomyces noursei TaxID=1971 RepID=UPI0038091B20
MPDDDTWPEDEGAAAVAEDIADLKARVARLAALVEELTPAGPAAGDDSAEAADADADVDRQEPEQEGAEEEEWPFPPFILLLEGEAYHREKRALIEWVEGVLVPGLLAEPSPDAYWCPMWIDHDDAVAALHALWLAWQENTDPASCGYTGPSVWFRDHYRPCMNEIRGPGGPFAGCTKGVHQIRHRFPDRVPSPWHYVNHDGIS